MTEVCARCGEEVRWGWRPGVTSPAPTTGFWMHRDPDVDHMPLFGQPVTAEHWAAIEAALDEPRIAEDGSVYTTRAYDAARHEKKRRADRAKGKIVDDDIEVAEVELPAPEVWAIEIEKSDERMAGGAKQVINLMAKHGWTGYATYSRGPRTHKTFGTLIDISDYVLLRGALDGGDRRYVGFWVNNKYDHAWLATADPVARVYHTDLAASFGALKSWIKGEDAS